jgi:hypothetical protein
MPRYFFNIILPPDRVIADETGTMLGGLEAAHWRAVQLSYQVRFYIPDDDGDWAIQIEDETHRTREVFVPLFSAAARSRKKERIDKSLTTLAHR